MLNAISPFSKAEKEFINKNFSGKYKNNVFLAICFSLAIDSRRAFIYHFKNVTKKFKQQNKRSIGC